MSQSLLVSRKLISVAAIAGAMLLLSACASDAPVPTAPSPIGFWGSEETDQPNLSFSAEAINGTDGCNRLSGSWTQEETGRIRFEDVASTRMYCDWVNTWLAELDSAVIDNDELHVFNASGVEIGTLAKN